MIVVMIRLCRLQTWSFTKMSKRFAGVKVFMIVAVAVGVVLIQLGFACGVVNALRTKCKHHLYERGGIFVMVIAILLTVAIGLAAQPAPG